MGSYHMAAHAHLSSELAGVPLNLLLRLHLLLSLAQAFASLWTGVHLTVSPGKRSSTSDYPKLFWLASSQYHPAPPSGCPHCLHAGTLLHCMEPALP